MRRATYRAVAVTLSAVVGALSGQAWVARPVAACSCPTFSWAIELDPASTDGGRWPVTASLSRYVDAIYLRGPRGDAGITVSMAARR